MTAKRTRLLLCAVAIAGAFSGCSDGSENYPLIRRERLHRFTADSVRLQKVTVVGDETLFTGRVRNATLEVWNQEVAAAPFDYLVVLIIDQRALMVNAMHNAPSSGCVDVTTIRTTDVVQPSLPTRYRGRLRPILEEHTHIRKIIAETEALGGRFFPFFLDAAAGGSCPATEGPPSDTI